MFIPVPIFSMVHKYLAPIQLLITSCALFASKSSCTGPILSFKKTGEEQSLVNLILWRRFSWSVVLDFDCSCVFRFGCDCKVTSNGDEIRKDNGALVCHQCCIYLPCENTKRMTFHAYVTDVVFGIYVLIPVLEYMFSIDSILSGLLTFQTDSQNVSVPFSVDNTHDTITFTFSISSLYSTKVKVQHSSLLTP